MVSSPVFQAGSARLAVACERREHAGLRQVRIIFMSADLHQALPVCMESRPSPASRSVPTPPQAPSRIAHTCAKTQIRGRSRSASTGTGNWELTLTKMVSPPPAPIISQTRHGHHQTKGAVVKTDTLPGGWIQVLPRVPAYLHQQKGLQGPWLSPPGSRGGSSCTTCPMSHGATAPMA